VTRLFGTDGIRGVANAEPLTTELALRLARQLVATLIDLPAKRAHVRPLGMPLIAAVNLAARAIDSSSRRLREPGPGSIFANYHVVAEP